MKKLLLVVLGTHGLTGCVIHERSHTVLVQEPAGQVTASNTLTHIRFPGVYKAYPVGRTVDPQNRHVMHESHVLYVRESPDIWNLHPPPPDPVPSGPAVAPPHAAYSPLPVSEELRVELNAQKAAHKAAQDQTQRLGQVVEQLAPVATKLSGQQAQIQQQLRLADERLRRLEESARRTPPPTNAPPPATNSVQNVW